jgi:hypothetical protein
VADYNGNRENHKCQREPAWKENALRSAFWHEPPSTIANINVASFLGGLY